MVRVPDGGERRRRWRADLVSHGGWGRELTEGERPRRLRLALFELSVCEG